LFIDLFTCFRLVNRFVYSLLLLLHYHNYHHYHYYCNYQRALEEEQRLLEEARAVTAEAERKRQEELEAAEMAAAFARLQAETDAADRRAREAERLRQAQDLERKKQDLESAHFEQMLKMKEKPAPAKVDPLAGRKNLRDMLRDEEKEPVGELPIPVQDFLKSGTMIQKHSKTANPRQRHLYMTPDLVSFV
jgi:hypothetical protein